MKINSLNKVPFYRNSNTQVYHVMHLEEHLSSYEWRPNDVFYAELEYVKADKDVLQLNDIQGYAKYFMTFKEFERVLVLTNINRGIIKGYWQFAKKNNVYSLRYIGERNEPE